MLQELHHLGIGLHLGHRQQSVEIILLGHLLSHSINSFLVWEVFRPLYVFIIPQVRLVVKHFFLSFANFFKFALDFPLPWYVLIIPQVLSLVKSFFQVFQNFFQGAWGTVLSLGTYIVQHTAAGIAIDKMTNSG